MIAILATLSLNGWTQIAATADLTVIHMTHPHLQPLYDPRRALIALGDRANVDRVIVDARLLIDAAAVHGDEAAIISAGSATIREIWDLPQAQAAFNS
jgi:cytosine/adenosine deaminase-related metal-dependent hydrolase